MPWHLARPQWIQRKPPQPVVRFCIYNKQAHQQHLVQEDV